VADTSSIVLPCRYYRIFPPDAPLGHAEESLELLPEETAFLLVDVYGLGYDEGSEPAAVPDIYRLAVAQNRTIIVNHVKPAKVAARKSGMAVVYATNYLAPSTTVECEWRKVSLRSVGVDVLQVFQQPTDILKFSRVIEPGPGDYVIRKQHYSAFFETHLESLLKELGIRNLVVVGFDSQVCLRATVTDALFRNYRVIVLRDSVGTLEFPDTREGRWSSLLAIRYIETCVGYTATSEDFVRACGGTV